MSKLEELIKEHCPDGCEYVPIWQVTIWNKKFKAVEKSKQAKVINYPYLLSNDLFALKLEKGNVFLLSTGEEIGWTSEKLAGNNLCEGEVVAIPGGGRANTMKYYKGKFVTGDNRIATSSNTSILLNKYLYYWFLSKVDIIDSFYRGAGIKHPDMNEILNMQIPLPPLPVQEEIVRILDSYSEKNNELISLLEKEKENRKKQYEYYRDKLLDFKNTPPRQVIYKRLGEICTKQNGTNITAGKMKKLNKKNGAIKIFAGGNTVAYVNYGDIPEKDIINVPSIIVKSRGNIDFDYYEGVFSHKNEMWSYSSKDNSVNLKFVYYFLSNRVFEFRKKAKAGKLPQISTPDTENYLIPLPPLSEQERIVNILDHFDALCNDLTRGIPAEIAARRKQYEYYRDKLLTFKAM